MFKATPEHKPLFIDILSAAFAKNKSINYIVKDTGKIPVLMEYAFDIASKYGEAYINDDFTACALITFPRRGRPFHSYLKDIELAHKAIGPGRLLKVIKRENLIAKNQPARDFVHLWFIGVNPAIQGKGRGSDLMNYILHRDHLTGNTFYLETSTLENISFYKKFNFNIVNEIDLGHKLYIMRRDN